MRVDWSQEQRALRDAVAAAVAKDAPLALVRGWAMAHDFGPADELAVREGWTGIGMPEELGGRGGGTLELAVLAEQLGYGAVPWDRTFAGCLCAPVLTAAGTEEARALAADTARGEHVAVLAVDARRPLAPGLTRNVLGGPDAHAFVIPFVEDEFVELVVVDADAAGVQVDKRIFVDRTRALADVRMGSTEPQELGTVPLAVLEAAADIAAVLVAADSLGAASRLLELTVDHVKDRRQFGVPVGSFQAVQHAAAEMLVDVEAARSAVMHGAWAIGAADADAPLHAAAAKSVACDAAVRVAEQALFLHGAAGFAWAHDLQFPYKRIKSNALLFGSSDGYRDRIGDALIT